MRLISSWILLLSELALGQTPNAASAMPVDAVAKTAARAEAPRTPMLAADKRTLPNGLEVLFHEDRRLPVVCVDVWYHVGSFHEDEGKSGFAHLFEHLMFQGSAHVPGDTHVQLLEAAGASALNGLTHFDRTTYFQCVPKNEVELALWLESDRMGWLTTSMTKAKLDEQRNVVKNERRARLENRPWGLAEEKAWQSLFPKTHPYFGAIIGNVADLDGASLEDVRRFHDVHYAPSNATIAIVGDIGHDEAAALVDKYFKTLPLWPKPPKRVVMAPMVQAPVRLDVEDALAPLARVVVHYLVPAAYQAGSAEVELLARILGHGNGSRLHQALIVENRLAQEVTARHEALANVSVLTLSAVVALGQDPEMVVDALQAQIELLQDLPPGEDELMRAVNSYESEKVLALQLPIAQAELLQHYNHYLGDPAGLERDVARMHAVTTETIQAALAAYLVKDKRVVLVAHPRGAVPTAPTPSATAKEGK